MMNRISICEALAKRKEIDPLLKCMMTEDEKWVTDYNIVQNRSWSKSELDCLKLEIDQKWPELVNRRGIVFHQDNAWPHASVVTHQNLWKLGWEVLMHPPYSPDLAPSDYHLFLALENFLRD
ncbi:putative DD34D transposase [Trichonephila clavipes]|nr:putative DD34D transposase [Trichonephila clavipes]